MDDTYLIYILLSKRKGQTDKLISKFIAKMRRHGYSKGEGEGLEEFVSKIDKEDLKDRAYEFVTDFEKLYYKDIPFTKEDIKRLENRLREI